ncbi:sensor domain-containing diguanylate cyclase [Hydrogenophaga sp. OTU3427]|uniref:sensor domain-containing diguanylate cyclase n=1 Tax=Hydrogenophaga sp. OTU3427 TaxID=3043856 RepID=UPI00313C65CB
MRTWLIALSLLGMLPLLVFSVSVLWAYSTHQQRVILDDLAHRADDLARASAERVHVAVSALHSLAESDAAQQQNVPALYAQAQRILGHNPDFRAVTLADAQGQMVFLTAMPLGSPTLSINTPELVQRALQSREPNVSGPFKSPTSALTVVAVTVPVVIGGEARYALRMILTTDSINELIQRQALPRDWIAGITDRQGRLLARNRLPERFVGELASPDFVAAINRDDGRIFQGTTLDGVRTTNIVRPIHGRDWYLALGVPNTVLNESLRDLLVRMVLLAAAWLGLALLTARFFGAYLVRQMQAVATAFRGDAATLALGTTVRITELWEICQNLLDARRKEALARSRLDLVAMQRDEVQDLYDRAPCGYHSLDRHGNYVQVNQTELNWLGATKEEVIGRPFTDFLSDSSKLIFAQTFPEFLARGHIKDVEFELRRGTGSLMPVLVSATAILDEAGEMLMSRSTVFDNTDQKMMEAQLERLARTDMLTSLSNRRDFYDQAEREIARARRHGVALSLMLLDIDHFKQVNDVHGHAAGDEVLRHLSRTVGQVLRETDLPARLGGEEFAVLMPDTDLDSAADVAERLRLKLGNTPAVLGSGAALAYTVSIGVAAWAQGDTDVDAALQRADAALYRAKHGGRNQVCREA